MAGFSIAVTVVRERCLTRGERFHPVPRAFREPRNTLDNNPGSSRNYFTKVYVRNAKYGFHDSKVEYVIKYADVPCCKKVVNKGVLKHTR